MNRSRSSQLASSTLRKPRPDPTAGLLRSRSRSAESVGGLGFAGGTESFPPHNNNNNNSNNSIRDLPPKNFLTNEKVREGERMLAQHRLKMNEVRNNLTNTSGIESPQKNANSSFSFNYYQNDK